MKILNKVPMIMILSIVVSILLLVRYATKSKKVSLGATNVNLEECGFGGSKFYQTDRYAQYHNLISWTDQKDRYVCSDPTSPASLDLKACVDAYLEKDGVKYPFNTCKVPYSDCPDAKLNDSGFPKKCRTKIGNKVIIPSKCTPERLFIQDGKVMCDSTFRSCPSNKKQFKQDGVFKCK